MIRRRFGRWAGFITPRRALGTGIDGRRALGSRTPGVRADGTRVLGTKNNVDSIVGTRSLFMKGNRNNVVRYAYTTCSTRLNTYSWTSTIRNWGIGRRSWWAWSVSP
ncbi:hypothetical protein RSOL_463650 [Rhizoctonia solani AG-3 Rhs1AP]|uniref:Uncharacterized protein n=2 Tax=Rhizoctonia solani AG-3 TaxID=1086053 RepID=A0A074RQ28_9AGAM|nr:hypothetical protein RSOL_463650 [Rhizoctonia solani AG-3 Rhs1AP]KEP46743.1 hypothetical protein V565_183560 [Rhizoctonia solani 123E]